MVDLSIIIPLCAGYDVRRCLIANAEVFAVAACEVIIVNVGGDHYSLLDLLPQLSTACRCLTISGGPLDRALAVNAGVALSSAPRFLFLNPDVALADDMLLSTDSVDGVAALVLAELGECGQENLASSDNMTPIGMCRIVQLSVGDQLIDVRLDDQCNILTPTPASGVVNCTRANFMAAGGMNSDLKGLGWGELDFLIRVQHQCRQRVEYAGKARQLCQNAELDQLLPDLAADFKSTNRHQVLARYSAGLFSGTFHRDSVDLKGFVNWLR